MSVWCVISTFTRGGIGLKQPNILLIYSDQHRFDCLSINNHPVVQTPNIDGLARDGINFINAYCPIPVCAPARSSLMTGQWATNHLCIANWGSTEAPRPMREDLPVFSDLLNQAGYRLAHVGKWQVHPQNDPRDYGFHVYVPGRGYSEWRRSQGLPDKPHENGWLGEVDPYISADQSQLAWEADQTIEILRRYAAKGQPFFIRWNPRDPHLPNIIPEPYASLYPPDEISPWSGWPDDLHDKPYIQAQQRRTWQVDGWDWDRWAPFVSRYLGTITLMDHQIGRVLQALDDTGVADNTLVVYTTDHGGMCGNHGMIDKHYIMYDDVVRVPLVARWPGRIPAGSICDTFVSNSLDLACTFCEIAGVGIPETFQGISMIPLLSGVCENGRNDIFATYHGNQFGLFSQRMVRTRRFKYIWNATAGDELYDVESDPGELHNLATGSRYSDQLEHLRHRLVDWMEETNDPLLNPWTRTQLLEGLTR